MMLAILRLAHALLHRSIRSRNTCPNQLAAVAARLSSVKQANPGLFKSSLTLDTLRRDSIFTTELLKVHATFARDQLGMSRDSLQTMDPSIATSS